MRQALKLIVDNQLRKDKSSLVSFEKVSKQYASGPQILDSIDLEIARGDFVALIGPSSCGKSTVLKLVANLITQSSGNITVGGGHASDSSEKIGYVFQDANLLPWATAKENIGLPLKLGHIPKEKRDKVAERLLSLVGLGQAADKFPRQLSGGMKMRVSIARALSTQPELLLLDEPFGALDEMTRDDLNEQLLKLRLIQKWTALFVTHSVAEAVFLSSRILVMSANPGKIFREITVDFPYPRTSITRTNPLFQKKILEVSQALHSVRGPE